MLETLKEELALLHLELPRYNLVVWTGGNISARDPETGLVVIKASGIRYEEMRPEHMVVMDMDGKVVEGNFKPSSDVFSHLYIYKHRPDVFGVVHTHSRYATAFAAVGKSIPCVLTAMGDEFGGPIPCAGFALIGDEAIGKLVVENIGSCTCGSAQEARGFHDRQRRQRSGQSSGDDRRHGRNRLAGDADRHA